MKEREREREEEADDFVYCVLVAVKVFPGPFNKGIFVRMPDRGDEEYQVRPFLFPFVYSFYSS